MIELFSSQNIFNNHMSIKNNKAWSYPEIWHWCIDVLLLLFFIIISFFSDVNWGSSTQAQTYKTALTTVHRLTHTGEHVKNYRPQILVLGGRVHHRPPLLDFANLITKNNSLLVVGEISDVSLGLHWVTFCWSWAIVMYLF